MASLNLLPPLCATNWSQGTATRARLRQFSVNIAVWGLNPRNYLGCGLVASEDRLTSDTGNLTPDPYTAIADWSRAGIGYTEWDADKRSGLVADWSRAGIG